MMKTATSAQHGWSVVAGAFAVMLVAFGAAYSFSPFFAPLQETFAAPRGAVAQIFSIALCLYFVLGGISGPLADRTGPRRTILFGILAVGGGLILAGQARTLWQVYLGFGVGVGIGVGFAYVPAIGAVQHWFVRQRGFASGIAVSGIGVGTLLMPLAAAELIDRLGWRGAWTALGVFTIIIGGSAVLFIHGPPQRLGMLPDGGIANATPSGVIAGATLRQALGSRSFWLLYLALLAMSVGLFIPFAHLVPYAEDHGISHGTAVLLFSMVGVGSVLGRFGIGGLADRWGRRRSLAGMYLGLALMLLWWLAATSVWQIALFALVYGICYGGFVALYPALTVDYFGGRNASGIIGALYTGTAIGTLIGPRLAGDAFDLFRSYTLPIGISAVGALLAVFFILRLPEPALAVPSPKAPLRRETGE